jgi:hypothetical protein
MCIDSGKALLADDNWGGCRAVDDGFESDEEEDEVLTEILRKPPKPKSVFFMHSAFTRVSSSSLIKGPSPNSKTNANRN